MYIINEDSRNELMAKSKQSSAGGLKRFRRRLKSKVANSTKQYNKINMNQLFKDGILTVAIEVKGETSNYLVKISFNGILDELHEEIERNNGLFELRNIIRALVIAFNKGDVYISCTCPDWVYRFGYWATKNQITSGDPENRPSDETNPSDNLGSACKHVLLVLSNTSWIIKVASVIRNYVKYCEKHLQKAYANVIYPAVYGKPYEEPVQTSIFDTDELDTDENTIDSSNKQAIERGRFKAGNDYRFTKQDKISKNQLDVDDITETEGEDA